MVIQPAYFNFNGWCKVIDDKDVNDQLTPYDVFQVQRRALYLSYLYQFVLSYYDDIGNITKIAQFEIDAVNIPFHPASKVATIKEPKSLSETTITLSTNMKTPSSIYLHSYPTNQT